MEQRAEWRSCHSTPGSESASFHSEVNQTVTKEEMALRLMGLKARGQAVLPTGEWLGRCVGGGGAAYSSRLPRTRITT